MRVTADRDRCAGSGVCADRLPAVFDQDDEAIVLLLVDEVPPELYPAVAEAVRRCPTEALTLLPG